MSRKAVAEKLREKHKIQSEIVCTDSTEIEYNQTTLTHRYSTPTVVSHNFYETTLSYTETTRPYEKRCLTKKRTWIRGGDYNPNDKKDVLWHYYNVNYNVLKSSYSITIDDIEDIFNKNPDKIYSLSSLSREISEKYPQVKFMVVIAHIQTLLAYLVNERKTVRRIGPSKFTSMLNPIEDPGWCRTLRTYYPIRRNNGSHTYMQLDILTFIYCMGYTQDEIIEKIKEAPKVFNHSDFFNGFIETYKHWTKKDREYAFDDIIRYLFGSNAPMYEKHNGNWEEYGNGEPFPYASYGISEDDLKKYGTNDKIAIRDELLARVKRVTKGAIEDSPEIKEIKNFYYGVCDNSNRLLSFYGLKLQSVLDIFNQNPSADFSYEMLYDMLSKQLKHPIKYQAFKKHFSFIMAYLVNETKDVMVSPLVFVNTGAYNHQKSQYLFKNSKYATFDFQHGKFYIDYYYPSSHHYDIGREEAITDMFLHVLGYNSNDIEKIVRKHMESIFQAYDIKPYIKEAYAIHREVFAHILIRNKLIPNCKVELYSDRIERDVVLGLKEPPKKEEPILLTTTAIQSPQIEEPQVQPITEEVIQPQVQQKRTLLSKLKRAFTYIIS